MYKLVHKQVYNETYKRRKTLGNLAKAAGTLVHRKDCGTNFSIKDKKEEEYGRACKAIDKMGKARLLTYHDEWDHKGKY